MRPFVPTTLLPISVLHMLPQQQSHHAAVSLQLSAYGNAVLPQHVEAVMHCGPHRLAPGDLGEEECVWISLSSHCFIQKKNSFAARIDADFVALVGAGMPDI